MNFPHIYRILTAFMQKVFFLTVPLLLITVVILNIHGSFWMNQTGERPLIIEKTNNVLGIELSNPSGSSEIDYWMQILNKYPDYSYGYLALAKLYADSNDIKNYNENMNKYKNEMILF